jgi:hypothetical protein
LSSVPCARPLCFSNYCCIVVAAKMRQFSVSRWNLGFAALTGWGATFWATNWPGMGVAVVADSVVGMVWIVTVGAGVGAFSAWAGATANPQIQPPITIADNLTAFNFNIGQDSTGKGYTQVKRADRQLLRRVPRRFGIFSMLANLRHR